MTLWSLRLSVFVKSFTLPLAYVRVGLQGIGSTGQWSADVSTWTNHAQDNLMGRLCLFGATDTLHLSNSTRPGCKYQGFPLFVYLYPPAR